MDSVGGLVFQLCEIFGRDSGKFWLNMFIVDLLNNR